MNLTIVTEFFGASKKGLRVDPPFEWSNCAGLAMAMRETVHFLLRKQEQDGMDLHFVCCAVCDGSCN
jgi:hypothetical protein